jgi:HlyD family secretion protein
MKNNNPRYKIFFSTSLLLLLLTLLLVSCSKEEKKEILTDRISGVDFENSLVVDGVVEAVRSVTLSCPRGLQGEVIYLIDNGIQIKDSDVVCVLENKELQDSYEQNLLEVDNAKANLSKTRANLDTQYAILDAQVKSNDVQTAIADLDSLQLVYASPVQRRIKKLELQKAAIVKNKLIRKLKALAIINKSQIRRMELQIARRENQAAFIQDMLNQMTIKSPQAGLALRAISWATDQTLKEGDMAYSGMPLVNIPDMSEMKVMILASEANYKRISIGDSVEYTFDAMPENAAWGIISTKAPIGQPVKKGSKVKYFEIQASIDKFKSLPTPGLTVSCKIIIKRVSDTIVVPQIAIFDEDSMKVVYVKQTNGYERRQIKTGASSPQNAVITIGLTGKESLSLIKPAAIHVKTTTLLKPTKILSRKQPTRNKP